MLRIASSVSTIPVAICLILAGAIPAAAVSKECLENPLAKGCSVRALPKTNVQGPAPSNKQCANNPTAKGCPTPPTKAQ
jgi:hypothetical protein